MRSQHTIVRALLHVGQERPRGVATLTVFLRIATHPNIVALPLTPRPTDC
jgi:hypothetical protein